MNRACALVTPCPLRFVGRPSDLHVLVDGHIVHWRVHVRPSGVHVDATLVGRSRMGCARVARYSCLRVCRRRDRGCGCTPTACSTARACNYGDGKCVRGATKRVQCVSLTELCVESVMHIVYFVRAMASQDARVRGVCRTNKHTCMQTRRRRFSSTVCWRCF
jgi:hypothetical protein